MGLLRTPRPTPATRQENAIGTRCCAPVHGSTASFARAALSQMTAFSTAHVLLARNVSSPGSKPLPRPCRALATKSEPLCAHVVRCVSLLLRTEVDTLAASSSVGSLLEMRSRDSAGCKPWVGHAIEEVLCCSDVRATIGGDSHVRRPRLTRTHAIEEVVATESLVRFLRFDRGPAYRSGLWCRRRRQLRAEFPTLRLHGGFGCSRVEAQRAQTSSGNPIETDGVALW